MASDPGRAPVPDLLLERYHLGELPPDQAGAIAARLRDDDTLRARLAAIERDDHEQRASGLPHLVAARARARVDTQENTSPAPWWRAPAMTVASVALLATAAAVWLRPPAPPAPSAEVEGDRLKGAGTAIVVFRRAGEGSVALHDGDFAREHDVIRIGYQNAAPAFGAIVSLDGGGVVTQHLPDAGTTAVPLRVGPRVLLDTAYELDAAPKWEAFCLVTGDRPFALAPVLAAARTSARDGVATFGLTALDVTCLTLRKDQP